MNIFKTNFSLISKIILLSTAKNWTEARLEWELHDIYFLDDEPMTCLCGHSPIKEICVLYNKTNQKTAEVGNHCVKKFMGQLSADIIFQAIRRLRKDSTSSLNAAAIEHAHTKGWITSNDSKFYIDIWRKSKLSEKQLKWKLLINQKIINKFTTIESA